MHSIKIEKYGLWALVTGASSGIGKEFARQLAAAGFNIVLVARTKTSLDDVAQNIKNEYGIETKTVAVDLGHTNAVDVIAKATEEIDVGLVVNNAAMILAGSLLKTEVSDEMQVIQVNITASVKLAQVFGKRMSQKGKGGIIFVAGMGGYFSMPYMANYMASKAYLISFGEALHYELEKKGIYVTVLCPGITNTGAELRTKGLNGKKISEQVGRRSLGAAQVVTAALRSLDQKPAVIPGLMNNLITFVFTKLLPRTVVRNLFVRMIRKDVIKEYL